MLDFWKIKKKQHLCNLLNLISLKPINIKIKIKDLLKYFCNLFIGIELYKVGIETAFLKK